MNDPDPNPDLEAERVGRWLEQEDRLARLLGMELVAVTPGACQVRMAVRADMLNAVGLTHGGATYALADFAFAVASNSHGTVAVALTTQMSYPAASRLGDILIAEAREVSRGERTGLYAIEVRTAKGKLVGHFSGTVFRRGEPIAQWMKPIEPWGQVMILHTKVETLPREDLEKLQLKRLQTTVERCYCTVGFYHDAMDELGVKPRHIQTLADTRLLPYTKKEHLRDSYPFGMFAVPMDQVVRVHASSGTTGKPTVVGYTARDIRTWASSWPALWPRPACIRATACTMPMAMASLPAGWASTMAPRSWGSWSPRCPAARPRSQIMLIKDFEATGLTCTPSYALNLAEEAEVMGVDLRKLPAQGRHPRRRALERGDAL